MIQKFTIGGLSDCRFLIIHCCLDNLVTPRCAVGVQNFEPLQNKRQHIIPRSLGVLSADLRQASPNYPDKTK